MLVGGALMNAVAFSVSNYLFSMQPGWTEKTQWISGTTTGCPGRIVKGKAWMPWLDQWRALSPGPSHHDLSWCWRCNQCVCTGYWQSTKSPGDRASALWWPKRPCDCLRLGDGCNRPGGCSAGQIIWKEKTFEKTGRLPYIRGWLGCWNT